tara:strand:+ start:1351 stop:1680 length:330 start_codon:yes stop_codon:yes gene_type:complete
MGRPKGSGNKPKNAKSLLDSVVAVYKKQGKKLDFNISDIEGLSEEEKVDVIEATRDNPDLNIPNLFELSDNEADEGDESDEYTCGNCRASMDEPLSHCPHCGAKLRWEE